MAPIRLPCLMGSKCEFQTVELEYEQAKQQLDGHMQYTHVAMEERYQDGPDLIGQLRKQLKSLDDTVTAIEAKESKDLARKTVRVIEALPSSEGAAVTTVTLATPTTCDFCGTSCGPSASASRTSRENHCPASSKVCSYCKETGHFWAVCRNKRRRNKVTVTEEAKIEDSVRPVSISLGEAAGLMYCIAKVSREVDSVNKMKVPHMLHEQLEWVIKHPPPQPCLRLTVNIDTKSYRDNKVKPPSAFKHRSAEMMALADTGCQAVCIGLSLIHI